MNQCTVQDTLDTIYLDQQGKAVSKVGFLIDEPWPKPQRGCRICLEPCADTQFCLCTGGMLTHERCLSEFLSVRLKNRNTKVKELKCEICQQNYEVEIDYNCYFDTQGCCKKIAQSRFRCGMYSLFFLIALLFYGYMGYLFVAGKISDEGRVALIIVAVCLSLLFVLFLGVWTYQYLFRITQGEIVKVLSLEERKSRVFPGSTSKIHPEGR